MWGTHKFRRGIFSTVILPVIRKSLHLCPKTVSRWCHLSDIGDKEQTWGKDAKIMALCSWKGYKCMQFICGVAQKEVVFEKTAFTQP